MKEESKKVLDIIDVHDLTEEQVRVIHELVKLLKGKKLQDKLPKEETKGEEIIFASWALGVKGRLTREEIYDYL
jgi:hypothetical protein